MVWAMKKDITDTILVSLIVILSLVVAISLILKLTNHSPLDLTILYSLVAIIIVSLFKVHNDLGKFGEFSENTKDSFRLMKEEHQQIRRGLTEIKTIMGEKKKL